MHAKPVISNSTPLVALWVLRRLELLQHLYGEVLIPGAVYDEFLATDFLQRRTALLEAPWVLPVKLANPARSRLFAGLDKGESEVLALTDLQSAGFHLDTGLVARALQMAGES